MGGAGRTLRPSSSVQPWLSSSGDGAGPSVVHHPPIQPGVCLWVTNGRIRCLTVPAPLNIPDQRQGPRNLRPWFAVRRNCHEGFKWVFLRDLVSNLVNNQRQELHKNCVGKDTFKYGFLFMPEISVIPRRPLQKKIAVHFCYAFVFCQTTKESKLFVFFVDLSKRKTDSKIFRIPFWAACLLE